MPLGEAASSRPACVRIQALRQLRVPACVTGKPLERSAPTRLRQGHDGIGSRSFRIEGPRGVACVEFQSDRQNASARRHRGRECAPWEAPVAPFVTHTCLQLIRSRNSGASRLMRPAGDGQRIVEHCRGVVCQLGGGDPAGTVMPDGSPPIAAAPASGWRRRRRSRAAAGRGDAWPPSTRSPEAGGANCLTIAVAPVEAAYPVRSRPISGHEQQVAAIATLPNQRELGTWCGNFRRPTATGRRG